jgi:hypothetical protein
MAGHKIACCFNIWYYFHANACCFQKVIAHQLGEALPQQPGSLIKIDNAHPNAVVSARAESLAQKGSKNGNKKRWHGQQQQQGAPVAHQ